MRAKHPVQGQLRVDLIAAVHVADREYYERLNRIFAGYDSVLYELIAEADLRPGAVHPKRTSGVIGWMQRSMKEVLGLEFQLDHIDYTPDNFVHADFSPEELSREMRKRGESFVETLFRAVGRALTVEVSTRKQVTDLEVLSMLLSSNREIELKKVLARQLAETDFASFWGGNDTTLIAGRNEKAIRVLKTEMAAGKRRLAIFYGAGHMADFHSRLTDRLDFQPGKTTWITAWDLSDRSPK